MADHLIFETGFFMSPNWIFEREDLTAEEKMVFIYLCRCYDGVSVLTSYNAIAKNCSMSQDDAVQAVNSLTAKGLVNGGEPHESH